MLKISRKMSVNISMVLTVIFFFGIAICAFVMPDIADLFGQIADSYSLRGEVSPAEVTAVLVVGYIVIGFACAADVMMFFLLLRVKKGLVFTKESVFFHGMLLVNRW